MIIDTLSNKKLNPVVTELFFREKKKTLLLLLLHNLILLYKKIFDKILHTILL